MGTVHALVRPARAFERSVSDASDLVLVPLNLEAAFAQEFVIRRAKSNGYEDTFLSYIPMDVAAVFTYLKELIDVKIVTAVKIHQIQGVVDICKPLFTVLTHH